MTWLPIETAPADTNVELGGYISMGGKLVWNTASGVPYRMQTTALWGKRKVKNDGYTSSYSHWRALPPPPE